MKKVLMASIALLMVFSFAACSGNPQPSSQPNVQSQPEEIFPERSAPVDEPETGKDMPLDIAVISVEKTKEDKWDELKDGIELIVVDITIKNQSGEEYEFNPNYVQLKTKNGYELVSDKQPREKEVMRSRTIADGESAEGIVCFELPEGTEFKIVYDDFDFSTDLEH